MASVNKVILIGNLGKDPEVRYTAGGDAVANFSIATSEKWKDKSTGEMVEKTEWHNIVMFGRVGEIAGEYLKKGSPCYVEGRLQTRKWTDKEGNDRYSTEVVGDRLQLLGSKGDAPERPAQTKRDPAAKPASAGLQQQRTNDFDDDIPF